MYDTGIIELRKIAENQWKAKYQGNYVEEKSGGLKLENFIGHVSAERFREFIIEQAKYNTELNNAVLIEFSTNAENAKGNKYSRLIQATLASVPHDVLPYTIMLYYAYLYHGFNKITRST